MVPPSTEQTFETGSEGLQCEACPALMPTPTGCRCVALTCGFVPAGFDDPPTVVRRTGPATFPVIAAGDTHT